MCQTRMTSMLLIIFSNKFKNNNLPVKHGKQLKRELRKHQNRRCIKTQFCLKHNYVSN
jgi:hypothetical protein